MARIRCIAQYTDVNPYHRDVKFIPVILLILSSCIPANDGTFTGRVGPNEARNLAIIRPGIHYKFAPGDTVRIQPDRNGQFRFSTPLQANTRFELLMGGRKVPIILSPGKSLDFDAIDRSFSGWFGDLHNQYLDLMEQDAQLMQRIRAQRSEFVAGNITPTLDFYHFRMRMATEAFGDTPLRSVVHRMSGEYLIKQLEALRYAPESINRDQILQDAVEHGFFTYESFVAQRAGIRDFTDAWIKSFPGRDMTISEADWKRTQAPRLDSLRNLVTRHIDDRRARAHAAMFLLAERLTEAPFPYAEASYFDYIDRYSDFPENIEFLRALYEDLKQVQPPNPAIPFELPDPSGALISLEDVKGTFVLLDFWASWCAPCLAEFPHMKRLHAEYSRKDVQFISISTEEDERIWRDYLAADPHPWIQVYAGGGFLHPLFQAYKGGGIPFYVLLDRNGNIYRYNDFRPSSNLKEILDDALTAEFPTRSMP